MYPHVCAYNNNNKTGFRLQIGVVMCRGLRREVLQHLKVSAAQSHNLSLKETEFSSWKNEIKFVCASSTLLFAETVEPLCVTHWQIGEEQLWKKKTRTQSPAFSVPFNLNSLYSFHTHHNSPIYYECQTQKAKVLALPWKRAHQDDSNDTPQPICEFLVDFSLLWIKAYPGLS